MQAVRVSDVMFDGVLPHMLPPGALGPRGGRAAWSAHTALLTSDQYAPLTRGPATPYVTEIGLRAKDEGGTGSFPSEALLSGKASTQNLGGFRKALPGTWVQKPPEATGRMRQMEVGGPRQDLGAVVHVPCSSEAHREGLAKVPRTDGRSSWM